MSIVTRIFDERRTDFDYAITLELPEGDGRIITILVPHAGGAAYNEFVKNGETYGLNLVTEGHYT